MPISKAKKKKIEEEEKYRMDVRSKASQPIESKTNKSKVVAGLLAIFFGGMGIHKFYLGKTGWGIIYILFSWTFLPMLAGFIEGIIYLSMSDVEFRNKYR